MIRCLWDLNIFDLCNVHLWCYGRMNKPVLKDGTRDPSDMACSNQLTYGVQFELSKEMKHGLLPGLFLSRFNKKRKKPRCRLTCCYELTRGFKKKKSQGPYRLKKKEARVSYDCLPSTDVWGAIWALKIWFVPINCQGALKRKEARVPPDCFPSTDVLGAIWASKRL